MSDDFWRFMYRRYSYWNWKLLIGLWSGMLARMFGFKDWIMTHNVWYGAYFDQWQLFFSAAVLIGSCLGLYAMWKKGRADRRDLLSRNRESQRRFEVEMERIDERMRERMNR
jgi:hypothetical protein